MHLEVQEKSIPVSMRERFAEFAREPPAFSQGQNKVHMGNLVKVPIVIDSRANPRVLFHLSARSTPAASLLLRAFSSWLKPLQRAAHQRESQGKDGKER